MPGDDAEPVDVALHDVAAEAVRRRAAAARGSRDEPCSTAPSEERRSVSCMTSAPKRSPLHSPTAVRQTPLTAIESPSLQLRGERRLDRQAHAVGGLVDLGRPFRSDWTSPVNTAHHSFRRADTSRSSPTRLALQREGAHGLGDLLDALALERVARGAPAEQQRREEEADLVDLAGVEERAGEVRAALEQDRGDALRRRAARARTAHAGLLVLAGRDDDLGARPSRARRCAPRGAARETTTVSGTSGAACTSFESSGRRASESKTTRRGWRTTPSTRAVSCGSSASAVPIPTATASTAARQLVRERAARPRRRSTSSRR